MATKKTSATTSAKKTSARGATPNGLPSGKMTKVQMTRYMAEQLDVPTKQVIGFLDLLVSMAATQTRKQGEFTIPGIGKLVKAERAARIGRNPQTGEAIKIKAKTTVKFRLSKTLKDAVVPPKA